MHEAYMNSFTDLLLPLKIKIKNPCPETRTLGIEIMAGNLQENKRNTFSVRDAKSEENVTLRHY